MYRSEHEERAVFLLKKKVGAAVFCLVLISLSPPRLSHTFTPFHSLSLPFFHSGSGAAGSSSWLSASCPGSRTRGASGTKSSRKRKVSSFFFLGFFCFRSLSLLKPPRSLSPSFSLSKNQNSKNPKKSPTRRRRLQSRLLPGRPRRRQPAPALLRREETGRDDALLRGLVARAAVFVHRARRRRRRRGGGRREESRCGGERELFFF